MTSSTHLRDVEFVDFVDGTLPASRVQHVADCPSCRARAEELSAALTAAAGDDVPEPTSVFWEQFSARVQQAVRNEPVRPGSVWQLLQPAGVRWTALAAAAVLIVAVGLWRPPSVTVPPAPETQPAAVPGSQPDVTAADDTFGDIDSDEGWALVRTFADELAPDAIDAAGVSARPGSAEGIALRMSDSERRALAQLLEDEIKRQRRTEASS
jgi:hypothetical protein